MLPVHSIYTHDHHDNSATKVPPQRIEPKVGQFVLAFKILILLSFLVALPGLEPGLFALRGRFLVPFRHFLVA